MQDAASRSVLADVLTFDPGTHYEIVSSQVMGVIYEGLVTQNPPDLTKFVPVLALRENEYVTAAEAIGASRWRILVRHILPGTTAPLIVKATLDVGGAIVLMAGLSFIGLGAIPPTRVGRDDQRVALEVSVVVAGAFPAVAIVSVVLSLNFIGDGLRDALDPRLRKLR
ncbi:MAG: ABC transporter permease subunit [Thermomicrobiales bacterium]